MRHAAAAAAVSSSSTASTAEHSDSHSDSRAHRSNSPSPTLHNRTTLAHADDQYSNDAEPYSAQSSSSLSSSSSASSSSSGSSSGHSDSDSEGSSGYKKGGYHPVLIGDVYCAGRYIIERKLGWGHFSTVWLATDNSVPPSHPHRFVAIKVQKSATQYTEAAEDEIKLLTCAAYGLKRKEKRNPVTHQTPVHPGRAHVITLLHHFVLTGPHGRHVCLVFECMGPNLLSLIKRYNYQGVPVPLVKHVTRQILLGLDWLHRVCGIIHTDLKVTTIAHTADSHRCHVVGMLY